jgi:hypothetical protein
MVDSQIEPLLAMAATIARRKAGLFTGQLREDMIDAMTSRAVDAVITAIGKGTPLDQLPGYVINACHWALCGEARDHSRQGGVTLRSIHLPDDTGDDPAQQILDERTPPPSTKAEADELQAAVADAVASLPTDLRDEVVRFMEGIPSTGGTLSQQGHSKRRHRAFSLLAADPRLKVLAGY